MQLPDDSFAVRVTPRASRNRIEITESGLVKVYVTAPPVDGEANVAVCELLAKTLKVPKSSVVVVSGETSRDKRIQVKGLSAAEVTTRLSQQYKLL